VEGANIQISSLQALHKSWKSAFTLFYKGSLKIIKIYSHDSINNKRLKFHVLINLKRKTEEKIHARSQNK